MNLINYLQLEIYVWIYNMDQTEVMGKNKEARLLYKTTSISSWLLSN